ncbi:prolyl oligopeptidase family serine peptidase [Planctomicrobium sp.]|nr:prolyl oligopeptidase family serine peptidase [Planctomicrobium sp.]MBT5020712.1 prolyl oligopeptidase family serine peptidase [Planctomicrobium sp.]MDB4733332.1 prolyl oligopeptidase family serine peptidase [Planctomicrobium sp.]
MLKLSLCDINFKGERLDHGVKPWLLNKVAPRQLIMKRLAMRNHLVLIVALLATPCSAQNTRQDIWDVEKLSKPPQMEWLDSKSQIRSLTFTGPEHQGKPTEVFAFYATPGTLAGDTSMDKNLPAVVCLHGGGGTAFAEWVNIWAKRGYAAIALDFSGSKVSNTKFDEKTGELIIEKNHRNIKRPRLSAGGPNHGNQEKFGNAGGDITDDWQYHAVSNILLAHSLIRSFPEIDAERTAVTGISWGGYLTCLSASVDTRFKAAVPVYGCGFLYEGESVQKPSIDRLPEEQRKQWIEMYDPSSHLVNCTVPILFVNGTNDIHYPLNSYMKSYQAVPGEKNMRIEVNMRHGHSPGWEPSEIEAFIASKINAGKPLAKIAKPQGRDGTAVATVDTDVALQKAEFHWTTDTGLLSKRKWNTKPAKHDGNSNVTFDAVSEDATIWYFTAIDQRGEMTSSEMVFADQQ